MAQRSSTNGRAEKGQSTTEFMLMLPVLLSILFFCIEMSLYFSAIHYGTYTAFATARSLQGGFSDAYRDEQSVSRLILTGDLWGTAQVRKESEGGAESGISVSLNDFQDLVPFPFITKLMPSTDFKTTVYLGPMECSYEYAGEPSRDESQFDNNIPTGACGN